MFGIKINEGGYSKTDFSMKKNILTDLQDAICNKFCESRHKNVWRSHGSIADSLSYLIFFALSKKVDFFQKFDFRLGLEQCSRQCCEPEA